MKKGYTILEALIVLLIVGMFLMVAIPPFTKYFIKRWELEKSLRDLVSVLRDGRQQAITRNVYVGIFFSLDRDFNLNYRLYKDGNGNGIRKRDIEKKIDKPLGNTKKIEFNQFVKPGILSPKLKDPSTGKKISNPEDPIKFGQSDICSFSPYGVSSSGSIFFTDKKTLQGVVRVYPSSGKIRILYYKNSKWLE